jgi:chaperone required for assembly of F1-ATPase
MTSNNDNQSNGHKPSGAPKGPITDTMQKPLIKRFYKQATVGDGAFFQILLDGRVVKTPKKRALLLPTRPLADAIAAEWQAQGENIEPWTMPLTRFANTAIDAVSDAQEDVAGDIVAFATSDLLCYRSAEEEKLATKQAAAWDPVLAWAEQALGAKFVVTKGVVPVEQPRIAVQRIAGAVEPHEPFRLTGLHVITTLTGSAILAVALSRDAITPDATWAAAHVDEDYQISMWGPDEEAADRRRRRKADFDAACHMLDMLKPAGAPIPKNAQ